MVGGRNTSFNIAPTQMEAKKKRQYEKMSMTNVTSVLSCPILVSSEIIDPVLMSTGQELGLDYDLSNDTDANTNKAFNFMWD